MLYTKAEAGEILWSIRECSKEILRHYSIPESPGAKTRPWSEGSPKGIIFHYTAGVDWKNSASWLNGGHNPNSSCHFLILDRYLKEADAICSKYPILDNMPVLILQLADLDKGTWHATWVNGLCIGIENRNVGILRKRGNGWVWWPNNWSAKFPSDSLGKIPIEIDGQWWEPFTLGQIAANILLGQILYCYYEGKLDPSWILPHSAVASQKMDTGRAFPLHNVREAITSQTPFERLGWLYNGSVNWEFSHQYEGRQGDCVDFKRLTDSSPWREKLDVIRSALHRLGYHVGCDNKDYDEVTERAVYIFQRSADLEADSIPGPKTQAALYARLKDFKLEK